MTKFWNSAVVCAAVAVAAVSAATAAGAEEWGRGEFTFDRAPHHFGPHCEYRIIAHGGAPVALFGGHHEIHKAEQRSINDWSAKASELLGPGFGNWELAAGKEVHCEERGLKFECVAAANPCREHHDEHHEHR